MDTNVESLHCTTETNLILYVNLKKKGLGDLDYHPRTQVSSKTQHLRSLCLNVASHPQYTYFYPFDLVIQKLKSE